MEVLGLALGKCELDLWLGEDRCLMEVSGIPNEQITSSCGALTGALYNRKVEVRHTVIPVPPLGTLDGA